jgi:hypothetical protein
MKADSSLLNWGSNIHGELGNGVANSMVSIPTPLFTQGCSHPAEVSHSQSDEFKFYPNPARDVIYFGDQNKPDKYKISVYAVNGSLVKEELYTKTIYVADLMAGLYFIRVQSEKNVQNIKLLKE